MAVFAAALHRQLCSKASTFAKAIADDIPDAVKMVKDGELQVALGLTTPDTVLTNPKTRVAVFSHFTRKYGLPVSSADFPKLRTTEDIAKWYENALRPQKVSRHAENLAVRSMGLDSLEDALEEKQVIERNDVETPANLTLDPKTFDLPSKKIIRSESSRERREKKLRKLEQRRNAKERRKSSSKAATIRLEAT